MASSMGKLFKQAVKDNKPLQVLGTINAYSAMLAQFSGAKAIYLSGAGVANASYGIPDLGMTNLSEVLEDARRIVEACPLPLLVDVDTGWGHAFNIARTIKLMEKTGVAAIHIEDQILEKRCGHRPNKAIVPIDEMGDRIKSAVDARQDSDFVIMARTDAYAVEGMSSAIERAQLCVELGADMVFPEAMATLEEYQQFTRAISVPVLANITEFGKTPLFNHKELAGVGLSLILYPLSAFRAMSQAALATYQSIIQQGTQEFMLDKMQTRDELYEILGYKHYEQKLDRLRKGEHNERQ
jgi:methylisocitrate lyase